MIYTLLVPYFIENTLNYFKNLTSSLFSVNTTLEEVFQVNPYMVYVMAVKDIVEFPAVDEVAEEMEKMLEPFLMIFKLRSIR